MTDDARAYALRLLGQRSYTTRDLTRKLAQKSFSPEEIQKAIQRFTESGLLDDTKFAVNFARTRLAGSGASRRRIRQTLARKGIPQPVSDAAIEQVIEEEGIDTTVSLERVARRKRLALQGLDVHVVRRRLHGFLARRGYDVDEIRRVVAKILTEDASR